MENILKQFEKLLGLLPEGWEEKAWELGAITRTGQEGKIQTARDLLFVICAYIVAGSFGQTSAILKLGGTIILTKNAVVERIRKCKDFLKWLCENTYRHSGILVKKPAWLADKTVYLIDASDENLYGSKKSDYRLHYCIDLFTLAVKELDITPVSLGEKLTNFKSFTKNDVVIADRAYGTIQGIEYLRQTQSDFVIRLRSGCFHFYNAKEEQVELADYFEKLGVLESTSVDLYYKVGDEYKPIRICALRKDEDAERKGKKRLKEKCKKDKAISAQQELYNRYIVVATSFAENISACNVLELYRMRWEVEIAFKRLKSLFHYDEIPIKKDENLAYSWFYSKLLLEAMCTSLVNEGRFSP